ncbi:SDR family oxidoreductase [Reinekea sp. G2M2-21]|uniref:UDP-glucose 4-epimerase family protein n=1 Tax=Reinekea sp. G2M2-21 TaxID=2788942 RepID=UPI0018AA8FE2|nr:SDR family oxidoreductase [Reinekea sp. G2M2-21]
MNVLVTGANGFLGQALIKQLVSQRNIHARTLTRKPIDAGQLDSFVGELDDIELLSNAVNGMESIIHCAARAHVMEDSSENPLDEYRITNVKGSIALANAAIQSGVKRFIYISSIKVNGGSTSDENAFTPFDTASPEDYYGQSKYEAEEALKELVRESDMELVIIRPPLVYGPGVKGNFASLLKLSAKPLPLPLGAINNSRSLVALDNLVDLIMTCIGHENAAGKTFLVSDDEDVSTSELLNKIGAAMGKKLLLLPVPKWLMLGPAKLLGQSGAVERLFGSLRVDISFTKEQLSWVPPVSMDEQLKSTIAAMYKEKK